MDLPLVSIIVVSYNQAKFINENLDSIKNQIYTNIELIVADDASTDNSVEIFEKWLYENKFPATKNFHSKNTGLATMLNECIELATGKYIKLIAADDFIHPRFIQKSVEKLESLNDDFGMVFSDTFAIDEKSKKVGDIADYNKLGMVDPYFFRKELIKSNRIAALTVLMKKEALEATGKYDAKFLAEDYYRWLKISQKYLVAYIPEKLAYYRIHENNISKEKADRIKEESILLSMIFDKDGNARNSVNKFFNESYSHKSNISKEVLKKYHNYPYRIKHLSVALKLKIPYFFYKMMKP